MPALKYWKHIEKDGALARRFQPIMIEEPTEEETIEILEGLRPKYEMHHRVKILSETLAAAAKLSKRYISDRFLPDKAIDVLDEAGSRVRMREYHEPDEIMILNENLKGILLEKEQAILRGDLKRAADLKQEEKAMRLKLSQRDHVKNEEYSEMVTVAEVEAVIAEWTGIPIQKVAESETESLKHLDEKLHERVVGQEEAVSAVVKAVRRGRVGMKDPKRHQQPAAPL